MVIFELVNIVGNLIIRLQISIWSETRVQRRVRIWSTDKFLIFWQKQLLNKSFSFCSPKFHFKIIIYFFMKMYRPNVYFVCLFVAKQQCPTVIRKTTNHSVILSFLMVKLILFFRNLLFAETSNPSICEKLLKV